MRKDQDQTVRDMCTLDFGIDRLGPAPHPSPLRGVSFVRDAARVSYFSELEILRGLAPERLAPPGFVAAGPRRRIYHDPAQTRAGIVTCGGLCPGINDVIKALVNTLYFAYGVKEILGYRYGYRGLIPGSGPEPLVLDPDVVDTIHQNGGSILGSSRGPQDVREMARGLAARGVSVLFAIGGDGTQRGAHALAGAAREMGLGISVVGLPKTIDNDLSFVERTFGFETAVYAAAPVISCAHDEAKGAYNGIGLVRLMGRDSGFIAASATLANSVVNFCLVPEVPFDLEGARGFLPALARRLQEKNHAVIVVAEGAGQEFFTDSMRAVDASGNVLHGDIGLFLKQRIQEFLVGQGVEHAIKYFDPSYLIRSVPAGGTDAIFCLHLAQNAVHAAMAGMTDMVAGYWHGAFICVPIELVVSRRRRLDPAGQLWQSVLGVTRQNEYWS